MTQEEYFLDFRSKLKDMSIDRLKDELFYYTCSSNYSDKVGLLIDEILFYIHLKSHENDYGSTLIQIVDEKSLEYILSHDILLVVNNFNEAIPVKDFHKLTTILNEDQLIKVLKGFYVLIKDN